MPYDEAEPRAFEFAFADAVNTLVADPHRATALGARGRARAVEHFGWDRVAERTLAVYESAILARSDFVSRDKGHRSLPAPDSGDHRGRRRQRDERRRTVGRTTVRDASATFSTCLPP